MIRSFGPRPRQLDVEYFFVNAMTGLAAMILSVPLALVFGGFDFFTPWFPCVGATAFLAGVIRRNAGPQNIWAMALQINIALLGLAIAVPGDASGIAVFSLVMIPASAAGVALGRRRRKVAS